LLAALAALALVACGVGVQLMLEAGFSARDEPTRVDAFIARWWRRLAVSQEDRRTRNPLPSNPEVLARGREHFAADCAICHGSDGRGSTRLGAGLYPRPPDLAGAGTQALSDGEIFWVVQNGVRLSGMPGWGQDTHESDQWTWEIVHFLRQLPRLSAKDVEALQAMRPRIPREVGDEIAAMQFLGEPPAPRRVTEDAHHEATFMGTVASVSALGLQLRTAGQSSISFLLDHPDPTRFLRGDRAATGKELREGGRVVVRAVRDQDWWLAREVRLPASGGPP
jgi:mono/diheme cytochrome c family protein